MSVYTESKLERGEEVDAFPDNHLSGYARAFLGIWTERIKVVWVCSLSDLFYREF